MKKQAAKIEQTTETAKAAETSKATKTPKAKAPKVAKEKEPETAPQLLPEAERIELRRKNMLEYNAIRKAVREGAKGKELEKLVARRQVLDRIYREQRLKEFASRK
jgi:hypothetical protein